jgi:hypothetical protein
MTLSESAPFSREKQGFNDIILLMNKNNLLIFLHRLPSFKEIVVVNQAGEFSTSPIKRCFYPIFLIIPNEIKLQYYFSDVTKFGRIKLIILRFINFVALLKRFPIGTLIFPYAAELSAASMKLPIMVRDINSSASWISRTAVVDGFMPSTETEEIDWDLERKLDDLLFLVFKIKLTKLNGRFINPENGIEISESTNPTLFDGGQILTFNDARLLHSKVVLQGGELIYPRFGDYLNFSGWPNYLPYFVRNQLLVTPTYFSKTCHEGMFFTFDNNWFHFLVETMSALVAFESDIRGQSLILPKKTFPQISEALLLFSPKTFISTTYLEEVFFSRLTIIKLRKIPNLNLDSHKENLYALRKFVNSKFISTLPRERYKIYLKRRKNLFRNLINRDQLENYLANLGYLCIDSSTISFEEQYTIIRQASVIVGESGAALVNIIFASSDCRIIEIKPQGGENLFEDLAKIMGLNYELIESKVIGQGNYSINLDSLKALEL